MRFRSEGDTTPTVTSSLSGAHWGRGAQACQLVIAVAGVAVPVPAAGIPQA
ncbi:hypothetical protein [Modestobacter sp. DSM 44400]|uniref:hypothetical protein n=1 Tax=Modestobacter sp. DSM 44400 TaxID=1550230 RepID=UPI001587BC95|nr:hypothetical protein [Modestobacter sp. DSM 44400]